MPGLVIDAVSHRYRRDWWALRDLTLQVSEGVLGLVGPNGAGKTTLLRIVATLLVPTRGTITWCGQDIVRRPQALRQVLGYVPQEFGAYPQLTAREFLRYIGELKGLRGRMLERRIMETLEAVGLPEKGNERLRTYSGGMMRRVAIAQALLAQPRVLILDEPTAGLDPAERGQFRELLASLQGERLAILSTHIISDVAAAATQVALLQQGQVIWTGTPAGLVADAEGTVWSLQVESTEFERLRGRYQISTAVRRGDSVEARLIATARPHQDAVPVSPTLEDAYLAMSGIGKLMAVPQA